MSIMDAKLEFSDGQTLASSSSETDLSSNVIRLDDLAATMKDAWGTEISPDIGEGNNGLVVNIQIASAFNADKSITAKIYSHTTSTFSAGTQLGSLVFTSDGGANDANDTTTQMSFRLPAGNIDNYLGIQYSHVTGSNGTGIVDAWLGLDTQTPTT
jgi:hypothetical protein